MTTITITPDEATAAAEAGNAYLIEHLGPGWSAELDHPDRLDIHDPELCVLGQLYGDYAAGARDIGITYWESVRLGFIWPHHSTGDECDCFDPAAQAAAEASAALLTAAWRAIVTRPAADAEAVQA